MSAERSDFVVVPGDSSMFLHFRRKRATGDPYSNFGCGGAYIPGGDLFAIAISVGLNESRMPVIAGVVRVCKVDGAGRLYCCQIQELETDPAIVQGKTRDMHRMLIQAAVRAAKALGYQQFGLSEDVRKLELGRILVEATAAPLPALPAATMQLPARDESNSIDV